MIRPQYRDIRYDTIYRAITTQITLLGYCTDAKLTKFLLLWVASITPTQTTPCAKSNHTSL